MRCPLCGGPLALDEARRFVDEDDEELADDLLPLGLQARVTTALWSAIAALTAQGALHRQQAAARRPGAAELAEQAAADAVLLRGLALLHLPPMPEAE